MHQPTPRLVCSHLVRVPTPTSFGDGRSSLERWFHSKILPLSPSSACSSSTTCPRSSSWDGDDGLRHLKQRQVSSRGLSSTPALERLPSCPHPPPVSRTPPPPVSLPAHLLALNGTLTLLCAVVEGISLRRRRPRAGRCVPQPALGVARLARRPRAREREHVCMCVVLPCMVLSGPGPDGRACAAPAPMALVRPRI